MSLESSVGNGEGYLARVVRSKLALTLYFYRWMTKVFVTSFITLQSMSVIAYIYLGRMILIFIYFASIEKQAFSLYLSSSMSASWRLNQYSYCMCGKIPKSVLAPQRTRTRDLRYERSTLYLCTTFLRMLCELRAREN